MTTDNFEKNKLALILHSAGRIGLIFGFLAAATLSAFAHPLGNFTINNFSKIEVEKDRVRLRCVLDMAEIPTFQESQKIDADKNGTLSQAELDAHLAQITGQYLGNLQLSVDGQPLALQVADQKISLPVGSGNLPTLRIEWYFNAAMPNGEQNAAHRLSFENDNDKERIGWNEIVVNRTGGINIFDSSAFGSQLSDELKTYPEDMLTAPLTERKANFSFTNGEIPANAKPLENRDGKASAPVVKDRLAELISEKEATPTIILLGILIAFGLGTLHALSPGHGKTVVGAYLVGSKGTIRHAIFLGLTVTITHTLGVFALGFITFFAARYFSPEKIMPYLSFISGLIILIMGLSLFRQRLNAALGKNTGSETDLEHAHEFEADEANSFTHTHGGSTHSHLPPKSVSWRSLLALGISGGLLPCPSALVLMLSAISGNRIGYGLILTLAFSLGLAATLMVIGLIFLRAGKFLDRPGLSANPLVKMLPVFSALVIACVGAAICYYSFA